MLRFIISRLTIVAISLFGVTLLTFVFLHSIEGDPIKAMLGERALPPERHHELMEQMGLNDPYPVQFVRYIGHTLKGDLGKSIATQQPVYVEFTDRFPATLELSFFSMIFSVGLGIPLGVIAALRRNTPVDHGIMGVSLLGYSMPIFWWGILMILLFSIQLGLTPVSGRLAAEFWIEPVTGFLLIDTLLANDMEAFRSAANHLILPAFVLGTIPLAVIARMTRSAMLEVLGEDYIRTAHAKGLRPTRIIFLHALRNALIPVITVIGLQVGVQMGGAILTETIFSWPGIGKWMVGAIEQRDYPVIQGGVLMISTFVILINLGVDLTYSFVNPKIRHARS